jgi:MobA/MobL family
MAVYHFHFKHGSRAKGAGVGTGSRMHAAYIGREGRYEGRGELAPQMASPEIKAGRGVKHAAYIERQDGFATGKRSGDLVHVEHRHFPAWAKADPATFWRAADRGERANARLYHEFEISIPRELSPEGRMAVVQNFVGKELGDKFAVTIAIHNPKALDGGEHPHAHVMFSSRRVDDGIERGPDRFFKKANHEHPELGGARKDASLYQKARLRDLRASWAETTNRALEREGHAVRIDHRSFKDRGIDHTPKPRLGPRRTQAIKAGRDEQSRQMLNAMRQGRVQLDSLRHRIRTEERVIEAYEQSPDKGGFGGLATIRKAVRQLEAQEQGRAHPDRSRSMFKSRERDEDGQRGRER